MFLTYSLYTTLNLERYTIVNTILAGDDDSICVVWWRGLVGAQYGSMAHSMAGTAGAPGGGPPPHAGFRWR